MLNIVTIEIGLRQTVSILEVKIFIISYNGLKMLINPCTTI